MKWEYKTLDQLGTVSRGKSKHRPRNDPKLFGGKYPFIQTADVKNADYYITKYSDTYNESGLAQSKLWDKGTLCITIAANIADTGVLAFPACFPDSIMGFVPFEGVANTRFIKYCFDRLQRDCKQISQGTAQDNLSWKKLSTIKFCIPEYKEQCRIADILSAYDDLIENNRKQIKLLEEAAQRLYKEWFVNLRFPGHENTKIVDGVPEGWNECTVESFGTVITGKTPPTSNKEYYTNGKVPFVTIPDMHNVVYPLKTEKRLTIEGAQTQKNKYKPPNSVMISCIGTVGLVSIATEVCQTNQQINSIILNNEDDLYFFYESMLRMKDLLDGLGSNGATMTNVNKSKLEKLIIISPSKDIVKQYNDVCKPLFESALNLSRKNVYLKNMREALLPKLMSGEAEV